MTALSRAALALAAAATLVAAGILCRPVLAHTAVAGWPYDKECCSGLDCAPVANAQVTATPEGWLVRIRPGDHPLAVHATTKLIPYGDRKIRVSGDENFHVCLGARTQTIFCVYVPPMGS